MQPRDCLKYGRIQNISGGLITMVHVILQLFIPRHHVGRCNHSTTQPPFGNSIRNKNCFVWLSLSLLRATAL